VSNLQKAQLVPLDRNLQPAGRPISVQHNPTEFTLARGVHYAEIAIPGLDSPLLQFVNGQAETLTLDLFFDSTDEGTSVTAKTDPIYKLVEIDPATLAPPVCRFTWAGTGFPGAVWRSQRTNGFQCVIESLRQRFTLFSSAGVPLRAVLTVTMKEYRPLAEQVRSSAAGPGTQSRTHTVVAGETLSSIAGTEYGDTGQWRPIAAKNNISDPTALRAGTTLQIPPLPTGSQG
jgi:hypothetical protein